MTEVSPSASRCSVRPVTPTTELATSDSEDELLLPRGVLPPRRDLCLLRLCLRLNRDLLTEPGLKNVVEIDEAERIGSGSVTVGCPCEDDGS